ncbi:hypothetical protein B484DRAFT_433373, partial [Ochromonadaceae sp. CCMP2298]
MSKSDKLPGGSASTDMSIVLQSSAVLPWEFREWESATTTIFKSLGYDGFLTGEKLSLFRKAQPKFEWELEADGWMRDPHYEASSSKRDLRRNMGAETGDTALYGYYAEEQSSHVPFRGSPAVGSAAKKDDRSSERPGYCMVRTRRSPGIDEEDLADVLSSTDSKEFYYHRLDAFERKKTQHERDERVHNELLVQVTEELMKVVSLEVKTLITYAIDTRDLAKIWKALRETCGPKSGQEGLAALQLAWSTLDKPSSESMINFLARFEKVARAFDAYSPRWAQDDESKIVQLRLALRSDNKNWASWLFEIRDAERLGESWLQLRTRLVNTAANLTSDATGTNSKVKRGFGEKTDSEKALAALPAVRSMVQKARNDERKKIGDDPPPRGDGGKRGNPGPSNPSTKGGSGMLKTNEGAGKGAGAAAAEAAVKGSPLCFGCGLRGHINADCPLASEFDKLRADCKRQQESAAVVGGGDDDSSVEDTAGCAFDSEDVVFPTIDPEDWLSGSLAESFNAAVETSVQGGTASPMYDTEDWLSGILATSASELSGSDDESNSPSHECNEGTGGMFTSTVPASGVPPSAAPAGETSTGGMFTSTVPASGVPPSAAPAGETSTGGISIGTASFGVSLGESEPVDVNGDADFSESGVGEQVCGPGCDCDDCKKRFADTVDMPDLVPNDSDSDSEDDGEEQLISRGSRSSLPHQRAILHYVDDSHPTAADSHFIHGVVPSPIGIGFPPVALPNESSNDFCGPAVELCLSVTHPPKKKHIIDSGCTSHASDDPENILTEFKPRVEYISLGNASYKVKSWGRGNNGHLSNVMWTPDMSFSMTSVSTLDLEGKISIFGAGRCLVMNAEARDCILETVLQQPLSATLMTATMLGKLYHVDSSESVAPASEESERNSGQAPYVFAKDRHSIMGSYGTTRPGCTAGLNPLQILHQRTGHSSKKTILACLKANAFRGAQTTYEACKQLEIGPCDACLRGHERQSSVPKSSRDLSKLKPMQEVGFDPVRLSTKSIAGDEYANIGYCYGSKLNMVYPAKTEGNQVQTVMQAQRD